MSETPFRFRLRSVLRVAKADEDAAQRAMAAEAAAEDRARAHTASCAEAYAACTAGAAGGQPPTPADAFRRQAATASLRAEALRHAEAASVAAGRRVDAARDEVLASVTRRRSLEELEERHRSVHALYAARAAQRSLDDLAAVRRRLA